MNIKFKTLCFIPLALAISFSATADECASLSVDGNSEFIFQLVGHNNISIINRHRRSDNFDAEHNYYLSKGKHILSFAKWRKKDFNAVKRNRRKPTGFKRPTSMIVAIDIDTNNHYLMESNKDKSGLALRGLTKKDCLAEPTDILAANSAQEAKSIKLPDALQYRLDRLMADLAIDQQDNFVPAREIPFFGAFTDKYSDDKEQLTVLAVNPYSPASRVGIQAGDKIAKLGGEQLIYWNNGHNSPIATYFYQLDIEGQISVTVVRAGKEIVLNGINQLNIIPQFEYSFSSAKPSTKLINAKPLEPRTLNKLSKLIVEIESIGNSANDGVLLIERAATTDYAYGIGGQMIKHGDLFAFEVTDVKKNSSAAQFGVKKGDIISRFNDKALTSNDVQSLSDLITQLKPNDEYTMDITRNNELTSMVGKYTQVQLPGYQLSIDTKSSDLLAKLIAKNNKYRAKSLFKAERSEFYSAKHRDLHHTYGRKLEENSERAANRQASGSQTTSDNNG